LTGSLVTVGAALSGSILNWKLSLIPRRVAIKVIMVKGMPLGL
jgi:hypothetical protein